MSRCYECENTDCACKECDANPCFYKIGYSQDGHECFTDYCIKKDEEGGNNFLGYDVDDPDDLEDCFEDFHEGDF